jgi:hypothetical protein
MDYRVECYSGWKYGERPKALISEEARYEIVEILKSWRTPDEICFHVRIVEGASFELIYDESRDQWRVSTI